MNNKKITISGLCLVFVCVNIFAQTLTLDDCIRLALRNNFDIQIAENNREIADNNTTLANAALLPSVDLTANYREIL